MSEKMVLGELSCDRLCKPQVMNDPAFRNVDLTLTRQPPPHYDDYWGRGVSCPHGTYYYLMPTVAQIAQWARDETP